MGELCAVLALPQSTVSRHLRVLSDEDWVVTRQEGTSRYYSRKRDLDPGADRLWTLVAEDLCDGAGATTDRARLADVLAQRRTTSRRFFEQTGGQWDAMRHELFGVAGWSALPALLDEQQTVGDLGCGTGHMTSLLAPWVEHVVAVDASPVMLSQAQQRLTTAANVDFRVGELEALPVQAGELDAAVLSLVLHYAADPLRVLAEAQRALRAGGRLLLVDILPHGRIEYRQQMGHVWLGFPEEQIRTWLEQAGFESVRFSGLPADTDTHGPRLFAAAARKPLKQAIPLPNDTRKSA